jgi:hypothetical protein
MKSRDLNLLLLFFIAGSWTLLFWCRYMYPMHSMLSFGVSISALMLLDKKEVTPKVGFREMIRRDWGRWKR